MRERERGGGGGGGEKTFKINKFIFSNIHLKKKKISDKSNETMVL